MLVAVLMRDDPYPHRRPDPWRSPGGPAPAPGEGVAPWLAEKLFDRRWIIEAKREETRKHRLDEAIRFLAAGFKRPMDALQRTRRS